MFSINCLEITASKSQWEQNKSLYKNLLSDEDYDNFEKDNTNHETFRKRFFFNDFYKKKQYEDLEKNPNQALPDNFFGNNINVQAIVGKNGSGKSTLMDLMYMAINNFSYLFDRGNEIRPSQGFSTAGNTAGKDVEMYYIRELFFVKNIYSKIYFSINNNQHILSCEGDKIILDELLLEIDKNPNGYADKDDKYKGIPNEILPNKLKDFFYTIVSNYSIQSFISSNYECDAYLHKEQDLNQWDKEIKGCWIDRIFHKNDGYKKSIVLNPFRKNGNINIEQELNLSKDRFIALVVKDKNIDDTYSLDKIIYSFSKNASLISTFTKSFKHFISGNPLNNFDSILKDKKCAPLKEFLGIDISNNSPMEKKVCLIYLFEKIIKIINRYPEYSGYIGKPPKKPFWWNRKDAEIKELLNRISKGKSHIELKAKRAINFLTLEDQKIKKEIARKKFDIEDYLKIFPDYSPDNDLNYIIEHLPPSIFDKEITLKNKTNNSIVDYKQLSSGEHQKYQTLSTHLYHLANLISVQESNKTSEKKRLAYKYVNLVFDEIEICFHPEYQRTMVNSLLQMLTARKMNIDCAINIILVTHSPFILSDIPASNILFLKDGTQDNSKKRISFAQNIGEMMYDSFFMEKTIGDFAESKLKELIKYKQGKKSEIKSDKEAMSILNLIGDPVIRSLIEEVEKTEVSDD